MTLFNNALKIHTELLAVLTVDLDFTLVSKIAKSPCPNDGLADGVIFIRGNFLRALCLDRTVDIDSASRFFADPVHSQNDSRMIIIFSLEQSLDRVSEFLAGPALGRHQADVRNLQFAVVVFPKTLRFVISIFYDTETYKIVRPKLLSVIKHRHGVCPHHRAGGRGEIR